MTLIEAIKGYSKAQIRAAELRYSPNTQKDAPNLAIESISRAVENITAHPEAWARISSRIESANKQWQRCKSFCRNDLKCPGEGLAKLKEELPTLIKKCQAHETDAANKWNTILHEIKEALDDHLHVLLNELQKLRQDRAENMFFEGSSNARSNYNTLSKLHTAISEEIDHCNSTSFRLLYDPQLLVLGEWGMGKTHSMCDLATECLKREQPVLLVLAKSYPQKPLIGIVQSIPGSDSIEKLLDSLLSATDHSRGRPLVIFDGVDEASGNDWKEAISAFRQKAVDRNVGFIVSCRTPHEHEAVSAEDLALLNVLHHPGFEGQSNEARQRFFEHLNIPEIEVPQLGEEFSRPLSLKFLSEALSKLPEKEVRKGFAGIASGQKGMTFVLEYLVDRIGKQIERQFRLNTGKCWEILKGKNERLSGIAPCMAHHLRDYISYADTYRVFKHNLPSLNKSTINKIIEAFKTNGLLFEDKLFEYDLGLFKRNPVIRLPYQRFSDHLIARHLLKPSDPSKGITVSDFGLDNHLSKIFRIKNGRYARPGIAQAVIAEYPERAKKAKGQKRELFFALPKRLQNKEAYFEPFRTGLSWRNKTSYSTGTKKLILEYLEPTSDTFSGMVDSILGITTKPNSEYNAKWLFNFLSRMDMPTRDLCWTRYLANTTDSTAANRYINGLLAVNKYDKQTFSEVHIYLQSLLLTTIVQEHRKIVTESLSLIGDRNYDGLFRHTIRTLNFKDPYVPERMLAACYGTVLALNRPLLAQDYRKSLSNLSRQLYSRLFTRKSMQGTHHAMIRDYALSIIRISRRSGCLRISNSRLSAAAKTWPLKRMGERTDERVKQLIESKCGNVARYDLERFNLDYLKADNEYDTDNIEWVIRKKAYHMGYRNDLFQSAEREAIQHRRSKDAANSIQSYSQKYGLISYYETWGQREQSGLLKKWRRGHRPAPFQIDPSFTEPPISHPPIQGLFAPETPETEAWIFQKKGPDLSKVLTTYTQNHGERFVLIYGYVSANSPETDREIFVFLQALFTKARHVKNLKSAFYGTEYPGNDEIPTPLSQHTVYFGEAGQSELFADSLMSRNRMYVPQKSRAFRTYAAKHMPGYRQGIPVEIPSVQLTTDTLRHTDTFSDFHFPAPNLIQELDLHRGGRSVNFLDANGDQATEYKSEYQRNPSMRLQLLYLRSDLLDQYLGLTNQQMVWLNWGERNYHKLQCKINPGEHGKAGRLFEQFAHIHRSFKTWPEIIE